MPDDDPHEKRVVRELRGETDSAADAAAEYEYLEKRRAQERDRDDRNKGKRR